MSAATSDIDAPDGALRLRRAEPGDEAFQYALFGARRSGPLRQAGLPAPVIDQLLEMQFRARTRGYRETFPDARWWIVERAGEPIGELVVEDETDGVHIVDISLQPEQQRRGNGRALVRALMREGAARGGVRAMAALDNAPSRAMFARLGFVETACDEANVALQWRP